MPIYNARTDVQRCVESILRHATGDWRLVLVDDASTDAALVAFLKQTAEHHPCVLLLRNEQNSGFVVSANRGMREARGRDVILLNSDTIVTEGFIDKLIACTYAEQAATALGPGTAPRTTNAPPPISKSSIVNRQSSIAPTGMVSPFTNNGTICSIPEFCRDNELPTDMSVDEYGRLVSSISFRHRPELVTAVGFCMYIRAEIFRRVGYFDEAHFGRGFGEENDLCERAKAAGFKIRLCDDLFIAHTGKASFGDEGHELERVNSKMMDRLHPRYFADVADFCHRNPLRELHANVGFHLARRQGRRYPALMFLLHASVFAEPLGGTEHVVRDLVENLALPRALIVFPDGDKIVVAEVFGGRVADALIYRFTTDCDRPFFELRNEATEAALGRIIDLFDVGAAHVQHVIRWPVSIWRALHSRGIPYIYTIHDYYCVCPSWNLLNRRTGQRCECPSDVTGDAEDCIAAQYAVLNLRAPRDTAALLRAHRAEFGALLTHAREIIAPSKAALEVVRQRHPALPASTHVIGHGYETSKRRDVETSKRQSPQSAVPLRVALLGQVCYPAKGADAYLELMEMTRSLPIQWHVFGDVEVYAYRRKLEQLRLDDQLCLHGVYRREDVCDLLADHAIDLTVLLPTCDETFCFTLSESLMAGVPVIVSNVGALPERIGDNGAGIIVSTTHEAYETLRRLSEDRATLDALQAKAAVFRHLTLKENADMHRRAYGRLWEVVTTARKEQDVSAAERELFSVYRRTHATTAAIPPTQAPSYHTSWWYPYYLRLKPFVPPTWRGHAKRLYLRTRRSRQPRSN